MAKPEISVIQALRETAERLEKATHYQWGHMGQCNCGFLAQVVTGQAPREIHAAAMKGYGDWSEQLNDYCPTSGQAMDSLIDKLLAIGFDRDDLSRLERLSDPGVLARLSGSRLTLQHNCRQDVVVYLRAWAALVEEQWADKQPKVELPAYRHPACPPKRQRRRERSRRVIGGEAEAETKYSLSPGCLG